MKIAVSSEVAPPDISLRPMLAIIFRRLNSCMSLIHLSRP